VKYMRRSTITLKIEQIERHIGEQIVRSKKSKLKLAKRKNVITKLDINHMTYGELMLMSKDMTHVVSKFIAENHRLTISLNRHLDYSFYN
jgi:hypothetical protein